MLTKENIKKAKQYCCEDISLIENYEQAINDDNEETIWICHHRNGIILNKTHEELEAMGLYYNRPACELLFLTTNEHTRLHNEKRWESQEKRDKLSEKRKKYFESQENRVKQSDAAKKRWESQEAREKHSKACKGVNSGPRPKFKWLTPDGEIRIMDMSNAKKNHKDWTLIGPVS